jgi:hypothetical protein
MMVETRIHRYIGLRRDRDPAYIPPKVLYLHPLDLDDLLPPGEGRVCPRVLFASHGVKMELKPDPSVPLRTFRESDERGKVTLRARVLISGRWET